MKNKPNSPDWANTGLAALYFLLAWGMYYFDAEYLDLGIHLMYKFLLSALIVGLSFLVFLVRTDLTRADILVRHACLLSLPHLMVVLASVPLWVFQAQKLSLIRRGMFDEVYGVTILLAAAGMLYVFGQRGLWVNLAAMVAANLVTAAEVILENGLAVYLLELRDLVFTFAGETGPVIQEMEIHELTFALGVYLVFYVVNWKEVRQDRAARYLLFPTLFCFLSGFKRIGAAAMAAALLVWLALRLAARRKTALFWLMAASCVAIIAAFTFICLVKWGIFEFLSSYFGLDTMGRLELSNFIDEYYWIGPDYFGNGAGFVNRLFSDLPDEWTIRALHNDILLIYIDSGFWGFWLWMLCWLPLRVWFSYRRQGIQGGIVCLCLHVFVLATAATDNTLYYIYVTGALDIAVMGCCLSRREERQGRRGYA